MSTLFLTLTLICGGIHIIASMMIVSQLQKRQVRINWFLLRLYLPKYAHQYKNLTLQETGKVGDLYRTWLVSINGALVFAIAMLVAKAIA